MFGWLDDVALWVVVAGAILALGGLAVLVLTRKSAGQETLAYRRRDWLLTEAERAFLGALELALAEEAGLGEVRVMCKVRLADLVYLPKGMDRSTRTSQQNRVNQKHVDFVLVSADALRPLVVIELDDSSHRRADRRARDAFLDRALGAAGLPLMRVKAARGYVPGELGERVREVLEGEGC